jgi:hypothetical protein
MTLFVFKIEEPSGATQFAIVPAANPFRAFQIVSAAEPYEGSKITHSNGDDLSENYTVGYLTTERY